MQNLQEQTAPQLISIDHLKTRNKEYKEDPRDITPEDIIYLDFVILRPSKRLNLHERLDTLPVRKIRQLFNLELYIDKVELSINRDWIEEYDSLKEPFPRKRNPYFKMSTPSTHMNIYIMGELLNPNQNYLLQVEKILLWIWKAYGCIPESVRGRDYQNSNLPERCRNYDQPVTVGDPAEDGYKLWRSQIKVKPIEFTFALGNYPPSHFVYLDRLNKSKEDHHFCYYTRDYKRYTNGNRVLSRGKIYNCQKKENLKKGAFTKLEVLVKNGRNSKDLHFSDLNGNLKELIHMHQEEIYLGLKEFKDCWRRGVKSVNLTFNYMWFMKNDVRTPGRVKEDKAIRGFILKKVKEGRSPEEIKKLSDRRRGKHKRSYSVEEVRRIISELCNVVG